jgi:hypothetical protein
MALFGGGGGESPPLRNETVIVERKPNYKERQRNNKARPATIVTLSFK